jgi:hypothetical protein
MIHVLVFDCEERIKMIFQIRELDRFWTFIKILLFRVYILLVNWRQNRIESGGTKPHEKRERGEG